MKRMDLFCSSSSSTAICSSLQDHRPLVRHSHRALDLYDSHLHDRKTSPLLCIPCSSKLPINPKPYFEKARKSCDNLRRKSSADVYDLYSPRGPSTYLLADSSSPFIDWFSNSSGPIGSAKICIEKPEKPKRRSSYISDPALKSSSSARFHASFGQSDGLRTSSSARSHDQEVVLRVSLHCKGCEGKVRKLLSKMEGVRSFGIDLAAKKVTVIGDVTPLGVLASVSKVKNAQLWPCPSSSLLPPPSSPWSA